MTAVSGFYSDLLKATTPAELDQIHMVRGADESVDAAGAQLEEKWPRPSELENAQNTRFVAETHRVSRSTQDEPAVKYGEAPDKLTAEVAKDC